MDRSAFLKAAELAGGRARGAAQRAVPSTQSKPGGGPDDLVARALQPDLVR
jgi:hypothetical protein